MLRSFLLTVVVMSATACGASKEATSEASEAAPVTVPPAVEIAALAPPQVVMVEDLDASGHRVFFSFSEGGVIDVMDENTEDWDVSFEGTDVRVGGRALVSGTPFMSLAAAPQQGFRKDTAEENAIPTGSDVSWYSYNFNTHVVNIIPNTIVIETANKRFAKMEILSFYKGGDDGQGAPNYFTFRYVFQPDGSRNFR